MGLGQLSGRDRKPDCRGLTIRMIEGKWVHRNLLFGIECKTASKPDLCVIAAGEDASTKSPQCRSVQVTSCQGWRVVSKFSCGPPAPWSQERVEGYLTWRQRNLTVFSNDELPVEASLGRV